MQNEPTDPSAATGLPPAVQETHMHPTHMPTLPAMIFGPAHIDDTGEWAEVDIEET